MDSKEIQKRVDGLAKAMIAKGLREPTANMKCESHVGYELYLKWKDVTKADLYDNGAYEFIKGKGLADIFSKAEAFIAALPSADEARMKKFMGALANVIDLGRSNGVEIEFLNPLQATMKKLSENILTDQRAA